MVYGLQASVLIVCMHAHAQIAQTRFQAVITVMLMSMT
jgi:hypothetical protein